jgi:hypothetical protein
MLLAVMATGAGSSSGAAVRSRVLRSARTPCAFHPSSQGVPIVESSGVELSM